MLWSNLRFGRSTFNGIIAQFSSEQALPPVNRRGRSGRDIAEQDLGFEERACVRGLSRR